VLVDKNRTYLVQTPFESTSRTKNRVFRYSREHPREDLAEPRAQPSRALEFGACSEKSVKSVTPTKRGCHHRDLCYRVTWVYEIFGHRNTQWFCQDEEAGFKFPKAEALITE